MTDEPNTRSGAQPAACPFVAFEDDRDHRSDAPDYRHRCFASAEPEPRAFPHQDRYCLSAGFTTCPVFLDWASQESAAVSTGGSGPAGSSQPEEEETAPAFLAGRPRPTSPAVPAEPAAAAQRTAEASAGLWSNEGATRRTTPTAPPPPSSIVVPQMAMARRGPSHPGWENPPRLENYPRLRSRDERHSNAPLMFAAIAVAVVFVALVIVPLLLSHGGGAATPNPSLSAPASGSGNMAVASESESPTPTAGSTPFLYTVKSTDKTLTGIASIYNITPAMIVAYNQQFGPEFEIQNPDLIWVGMQFYIPPPGWTPPPATPTPSTSGVPTDTSSPSASPAS